MNDNKIKSSSPLSDLQHQQLLLRMEYEYEKEEFRRQTETMGIARKVKRGLCWYPVGTGRSFYNSLNQLVIEIERKEDKDIEHVFEFGRPVCFFEQGYDGKIHYFNSICTVSYADEERMVVAVPGAGSLLEIQGAERLGVQLYFDETSYRTMFEALEDVIRAKGNRLAELRDILLSKQPSRWRGNLSGPFPLVEQHSGSSSQQSTLRQRRSHRSRSSGDRKDHHSCRSHLRDLAPRKSSPGLCTKQHGRRLDCREAGGPRSTCIAYRQSEPGK